MATSDNIHGVSLDFGEIINSPTLGAGLTATSALFEDLQWVGGLVVSVNAGALFELAIIYFDADGVQLGTRKLVPLGAPTGGLKTVPIAEQPGYGMKLQVKNLSGAAAAFTVRAQVVR